MRIIGLAIINIILIIILGLTTKHFLTKDNLIVIIDNMALEAVVLSGYTLLLVGGYFDLSVDGVASLTGIIFGLLVVAGLIWPIAMIVAMILSAGIGAINGLVVAKLGINGFIATLTTWWICIGAGLGLTKAISPYNFPHAFQMIGQTRIFGVRILVIYAIIAITFFSIILNKHIIGAHILVSGDNRIASKMMGINVEKLGMGLYILVGILAGFVGIMTAARLNAASPVAVDGMTLKIIAAIVIGGSNLTGGKGSIIGGILGLLLMNILSNASIQLGISPYWQKAVLGGILLIAVLSERSNIQNIFNFRRIRNEN